MTRKTKYLGLESGKSSKRWFTQRGGPHTGDGVSTTATNWIKVVFKPKPEKK